jgi:saccharopine dehydrogenase (NADP+, L-glutamate forming)
LVKAGLTDEKKAPDPHARNIKQWSAPVLPWVNETNRAQLAFLGLFEDSPLPQQAKSNADILQYLLETRLAMQPDDKDMIVMLHEIDYTLESVTRSLKSALMVKGENNIRTAMAKTVGLPLGIAAIQILLGEITLKGLHIPILPEIYGPVLKELGQRGIRFREVFS